ncbi:MAG: response regulator, partial [Bacteroidetes bacterium]|nr:response regulator [Bacteroidota bacterium]
MKYTISLIDDEPLSLAASKGIIQDFFSDIHIMATFDNTLEAMKMLSQVPCDLLLVDIRMPGMNGLEFVNTLREFQNVEAIFLTGYDEFAIQALKTGAFDYLL